MSYVALFTHVKSGRKDVFFTHYADGVAQAVLYCLFLAYPKSRPAFTTKLRQDLLVRITYWQTGVRPQFVQIGHWKLNLGGELFELFCGCSCRIGV